MLSTLLEYLSTSYSMNFLALYDDVKFIIANHLASDLKIRELYIHMYVCLYVYTYVCRYACLHVCITYVYTRYVLTNAPIPSSRCKHFVNLRPNKSLLHKRAKQSKEFIF